jgi:hypothetical protein
VLVLVGGLVGGLFGREGGGCRGVGGGGGLWGVLGASGGGRKGQGSDLVMEFPPYATALRRHPRSPTKQPNRKPLRLEVHESRHRRRIVPLADTTGRKLGRISPPREISNFGAGDEIIQTHLRFRAMLTCRFARRPPCRSHVPGGALIEYPPPPHTELLAFDGTEGAKLVFSEETSQNFV